MSDRDAEHDPFDVTGATILIVDDEPDMQFLVSATLQVRASEFEVVATASDGAEGIALWRTHRPDVILLDQRMPDMSGLEVAERILAEDCGQCIVIFSAFVTDEVAASAAAIGVRRCVSKDEIFDLPAVLSDVCAA